MTSGGRGSAACPRPGSSRPACSAATSPARDVGLVDNLVVAWLRHSGGRRVSDDDFTEVFRAEQRRLVELAYVLCGDFFAAEDAVVEAAAKVLVRWRRSRVENLRPYLRRAVVNEVRSAGRRRGSQRARDHKWAARNPSAHDPADRQAMGRVDAARLLEELPLRQRVVVALRFLNDRSVEETAEILAVSRGTVKSQTAKAIAKLRELAEVVSDGE